MRGRRGHGGCGLVDENYSRLCHVCDYAIQRDWGDWASLLIYLPGQ
jgi:hypothetical protein